jgi:general transcription factor IIIA
MPTATKKRKASSGLDESAKRLRVEKPLPRSNELQLLNLEVLESSLKIGTSNQPLELEEDDEEDDYKQSKLGSSDEEETADTPVTPFSPARKKFPSELKTIKCTYGGCTKTFNRPARLTAHLRSHTNERPYVCAYEGCDKAYLTDKHLQTHIKGSHTHERSYHCDWEGCDKSFLTSTRLKRHKEAHKGHERFRCTAYPPCNQTFRKHQTLQRHIRSDHLELAPYSCTYIDPITSEPCNAGFDGAVGLRKHEERVHGAAQFFCPQCTIPGAFSPNGTAIHLGFATDTQLQSHVRKEHANCPFCDLKCSSQRELQNHIDGQHSGKSLEERKKISCTYVGCNKKFTKPGNLKIHIRTAHMGERYICGTFDLSSHPDVEDFDPADSCGKDFVSKVNLIDHIRTAHLGLPSAVNANRKKNVADSDDFIETDEDEYIERPKKNTKRRAKKAKATEIDQLLGTDPNRNIFCLIPTCSHKFIRDYDLQVHLRTVHESMDPDPSLAFPDFESAFQFPGDDQGIGPGLAEGMGGEEGREEMDASYNQADIDWELQRRALEGGAFWIGADEEVQNDFGGGEDEWTQGEMEMRRLVGDI